MRYRLLAIALGLLPSPAWAQASPFRLQAQNGLVLQVVSASAAPCAHVVQAQDAAGQQQRLSLKPLGAGRFQVAWRHSMQCLSADGRGDKLHQEPCETRAGPSQTWRFLRGGHGRLLLHHPASQQCAAPPSLAEDKEAQPWALSPCRAGSQQALRLVDESGGAVRHALTAREVRLGGTLSTGQRWGLVGIASPDATTQFRALGGKLYVHELGWAKTSLPDLAAIQKMFPDPPIWESSMPPDHVETILRDWVAPRWQRKVPVTCLNGDWNALSVDQAWGQAQDYTHTLGLFVSPNYSVPAPDWRGHGMAATRSASSKLGALCLDAPPSYYLAREPAYRTYTAAAIRWARRQNVRSVAVIYPYTDELAQDAPKFVRDLERRDARPDVYAGDVYASVETTPFPLGDEKDPNTLTAVMLQILRAERRNYPF